MLGHGFWQRRFGSDPSILGRTIGLNGIAHTIVGVLPASFRGLSGQAELWIPVMTRSAGELGEAWNHSYSVVARRRQDVTPEQALAATRVLGAQVNAQFEPGAGRPNVKRPAWSASAVPLNDERIDPLIRRSVMLLLGAVLAVLLIVCVNIANLMLVRALGRQHEVAIRLALGASRLRIVRLLMTESGLLAILGGIVGVVVAYGAIVAGAALLPDLGLVLPRQTGGLTRVSLHTLGVDWRTILFTIAIVAGTAALFGLGPAWRVSCRDLTTAIKSGVAGAPPQGGWRLPVRHLLIVGEVALALVLLSAGGLMLKSVARLQATELGFNADSLLTVRLTLPAEQYDYPRGTQLLTTLVERLKTHGQLQAVAYGSCAPLTGMCNGTTARFPDRPLPPNMPAPFVSVHWASPEYFDTLGIRLVRGRTFTEHDRTGQPKVVVINETAARALWPNADPIGQRVSVGQGGFGDGAEVVGLVADVRYGAVEASIGSDIYIPVLQSGRRGGLIFVRAQNPARLVPSIRQEVEALDPDLPLIEVKMMEARFGDATWRTRTSAWLLGAFSALALALSAIGIYGVVSQSVAQRSRELGVRLALGASRRNILNLVLVRAFIFAFLGVVIGIALALPATRLLEALLFQVRPGDPIVLSSLALMLLAVAALASYIPARRATRVDPMLALRRE
jgi:putative ABC transport system permease protein